MRRRRRNENMRHAHGAARCALIALLALPAAAQEPAVLSIFDAIAGEARDAAVPEISTRELKDILQSGEAIVFDSRPYEEFALGHIEGAVNLAAKPGVPMSVYISDVAEVERLLKGNRATGIVLYCNGPFCPKSRMLAAELIAAGYQNVRRYQLGMPLWRVLGGPVVVEPPGFRHILANDKTAVFVDARDRQSASERAFPGAVNIPRDALADELELAKDDGRLPMADHNTRIVVFGSDGREARAVAVALAGLAFANVAYFDGSFEQLTGRPVFMRRL